MIKQDRDQSPVKPHHIFGPKTKNCILAPFWPFLAQVGQNRHKNIFSLSWDQMISNEGSHAYVWTKLEKNDIFGPKMGFRAQKKPKNDFFQKMKETSPGNIPNFRKTQENNTEDHPGT